MKRVFTQPVHCATEQSVPIGRCCSGNLTMAKNILNIISRAIQRTRSQAVAGIADRTASQQTSDCC